MHKTETAFRKGYRVDRSGVPYGVRGRVIATTIDRKGYLRFTVCIGTKHKGVYIHQLQAYQKFGHEMFKEGIQVRHLNGNAQDNSWDNIAIGTASDNRMDVPVSIRRATALLAGRTRSSLTVEKVREIRQLRRAGWNYAALMAKFGVAKTTISYIVCGKTWRSGDAGYNPEQGRVV